jgi:hypothetical protein
MQFAHGLYTHRSKEEPYVIAAVGREPSAEVHATSFEKWGYPKRRSSKYVLTYNEISLQRSSSTPAIRVSMRRPCFDHLTPSVIQHLVNETLHDLSQDIFILFFNRESYNWALVCEILNLYTWERWNWRESWRCHSWNAWHWIRSFETPKSTE